ncbi:MAG: DUF2492 family protein [Candidatus Woesearchaeota archaeon]
MRELHGHEVIAFIKNVNPPIKKSELLAVLQKEFSDTKFHTCSQSDLTIEGLLEFLESAEKLVFVKGMATINTGNVCSDGD